MRLADLSPAQREARQSFVDTLLAAGWDAAGWEVLLAGGAVLVPEAQLEYRAAAGLLRVGLSMADEAIVFERVGGPGDVVSARLFPDGDAAPVLRELIDLQDSFDDAAVADFLLACVPRCRAVLLDTSQGPVAISL